MSFDVNNERFEIFAFVLSLFTDLFDESLHVIICLRTTYAVICCLRRTEPKAGECLENHLLNKLLKKTTSSHKKSGNLEKVGFYFR
jgi:hypothetical protein